MARQSTIFEILIASPSDVNEERQKLKEIIHNWNVNNSKTYNLYLHPVMWESAVHAEVGISQQDIISGQIDIDNIDMTIGIFGHRLGTPTENYLSGTIEELEKSIKFKKPTMMFFSKEDLIIPNSSSDEEADYIVNEKRKLKAFKTSRQINSISKEFKNITEFEILLTNDLQSQMNSICKVDVPNIKQSDDDSNDTEESMENIDVLVIGGANIEYIYKQKEEVKFLIKQKYDEKKIEYGGSGLNYTLRLTATKINVIPILPIGEDSAGKDIVKKLIEEREKSELSSVNFQYLLKKNVKTIDSLILSDKKGRTILSKDNDLTHKNFNKVIAQQIKDRMAPKFLMIGHIHSDKGMKTIDDLSTNILIERYYLTETKIYLNLGRTQLEYGYDFWKNTLAKVDILQLNIDEIKFFINSKTYQEKGTLSKIITQLSELNINIIITLDQLGAICITKDEDKYYAPEINIESIYKDKTGAGDAFASGMVYQLLDTSKKDMQIHINSAIQKARLWATYACTSLGGASDCPSIATLKDFETSLRKSNKIKQIETLTPFIIDLVDKAYAKC